LSCPHGIKSKIGWYRLLDLLRRKDGIVKGNLQISQCILIEEGVDKNNAQAFFC